jgi:hypothetical protein
MAPAMSCININQQHKATIQSWFITPYPSGVAPSSARRHSPRQMAPSIRGSTGLINSGLCVHPRDVLEIRANRRTNCHKTHRDFAWRLRFQSMPSEVKRETPLTCWQIGSNGHDRVFLDHFRIARHPSRADAKCGDHLLQADTYRDSHPPGLLSRALDARF